MEAKENASHSSGAPANGGLSEMVKNTVYDPASEGTSSEMPNGVAYRGGFGTAQLVHEKGNKRVGGEAFLL